MTGAGTLAAGVMVALWLPGDIGLAYMLVGEGLAFILIGIVGMVMSLTTQDVAQGIKDAISEDGDKTREVIGGLRGDIGGLRGDIGGLRGDIGKMLEKQDQMLETQNRLLEKQDQMLETQNRLLEKQDQTGDALLKMGETLGRLVVTQNRLLEKLAQPDDGGRAARAALAAAATGAPGRTRAGCPRYPLSPSPQPIPSAHPLRPGNSSTP